jgi:hypothetical protein
MLVVVEVVEIIPPLLLLLVVEVEVDIDLEIHQLLIWMQLFPPVAVAAVVAGLVEDLVEQVVQVS